MCVLSKSEVLHRGEHLAERIRDLCHGRYLPVKVPAKDSIHLSPLTRIDPHINLRTHGHPLNKTSQSYKETTEEKLSHTGLRLAMRHPKYRLFEKTESANKMVLEA